MWKQQQQQNNDDDNNKQPEPKGEEREEKKPRASPREKRFKMVAEKKAVQMSQGDKNGAGNFQICLASHANWHAGIVTHVPTFLLSHHF